MNTRSIFRNLAILALRAGLILVLVSAGWLVYRRLPSNTTSAESSANPTSLQIVLRQPPDGAHAPGDVAVELYPVDIVAVRHEYFTEPRAGKRFDDFLKERMKGRSPISVSLDKQGRGAVVLAPGSWWLHAKLSGDEQLEWRLPVNVNREPQIIELSPQNAYTRSKSF